MPDKHLVTQFARAMKRKRDGEKIVNDAKREIAEIEPVLLPQFTEPDEETGSVSPKQSITLPERDVNREAVELLNEVVDASEGKCGVFDFVVRLRDAGLLIPNEPATTFTVFVGSRIWASPKRDDAERDKATDEEYERACRALEAHGFGEYVQERFNVVSLSSAMKEEVEHGRIEPGDVFDGAITVEEKFTLQARKA